jgi:hypothetical protein
MILEEQTIEKGTLVWKVGDPASFAFLVKRGEFKFEDCIEAVS